MVPPAPVGDIGDMVEVVVCVRDDIDGEAGCGCESFMDGCAVSDVSSQSSSPGMAWSGGDAFGSIEPPDLSAGIECAGIALAGIESAGIAWVGIALVGIDVSPSDGLDFGAKSG